MDLQHRHEHMNHETSHHNHNDSLVVNELMVEWQINPKQTLPEQKVEILLIIKDNDRKSAPSFAVVHEKQMHLLAISKDLSSFQHLHPEYKGEGLFVVNMQFPKAGDYKLYADFKPEGGAQQLATFEIHIEGETSINLIEPDQELKKTVNGLQFELKFEVLAANRPLVMDFTVKDANSLEPITKLETYLGSAGHVVIVSEDLENFLHVHPANETTTGPTISYMTSFPKPGIFKVWGQFKHKGELYTVPFVIVVPTH